MPKFQKNTGFKLRSGKSPSFKMMGSSSPVNMKYSSPLHWSPEGKTTEEIKARQRLIGVDDDGVWGDNSKTADKEYEASLSNADLEGGDVPDIVKRWQYGKAGAEDVEEKYRKVVDAEGEERYISKGQGFGKGTKEYLEERYDEPGYNIWTDESLKKRLRDPSAKYHTKAEMYKDTVERKHGYKSGTRSWRGEDVKFDPAGKTPEEIKAKQKELNVDADGVWGSESQAALDAQPPGFTGTDEQRGYNPWLRKLRSSDNETVSKVSKFLSPMSSEERRQNRLERKIKKAETARSTGKLGISFNLLSGFRVEPKADILQRKIDKLQHKQNVAKYKQDVEREYDALDATDKKTTPAPTRRKKVQETKEKLIDKVKK